ncbi:MAG: hypothetical protein C0417_12560 [Chlorobiaceae bacterium]|nr:hypothetical protein [Chlorobiaceae bacterium]
MIRNILENFAGCDIVPEKVREMQNILAEALGGKVPNLDIDVMGCNSKKKKIITIQLRSRDDTGGTTAKGSLVDMLRGILRMKAKSSKEILYLVAVWDERDSQQKSSTISKMYSSLKDLIDIDEDKFQKDISSGVSIDNKITLKMAYGVDEIMRGILGWSGKRADKTALSAINNITKLVEIWDDLWISYTLASLEIEVRAFKNLSNIKLLNNRFKQTNSKFDFSSYKNLVKSIDDITNKIVPIWKENSIPLKSPSDQIHYIRDMLFLKACYDKNQNKKKVYDVEKTKVARKVREPNRKYQLDIFPNPTENIKETETDDSELKPQLVSFRDYFPEITDTGYLTHSIYYYPAKFIPHVVKYCIEEYTDKDDWIIDPFAGSGTVGLEAFIHERNAVLYDLNLLLNHIMPIKIFTSTEEHSKSELHQILRGFDNNKKEFLPTWISIEYWYPEEMLQELCTYWGYLKSLPENIYSMVIKAALVKASKHFSYAEHRTPKLFRSKSKKHYIEELLKQEWKTQLKRMIYSLSLQYYDSVCHLQFLTKGHTNQVLYYSGVDSAYFNLEKEIPINCLITSPPYLQAQEYIRTAKLELYWLGHTEGEIKGISKLEIPYRKSDQIFETKTLNNIKSKIERVDLLATVDSYFCYTIKALERAMSYIKSGGKSCIFVGNPTVEGKEVETWRILMEYFCDRGFDFEKIFDDRIKSRQLFGSRNNKNPDGMKSEYMLILSKK